MADITNLFKATVKTVKTKDKTLAINIDKSILPKAKKSEFAITAKNVVTLITKLKDFLLENRKDYLNATGFFGVGKSQMTDLDRDQIDSEAETFMKTCQDAIKQLKVQASRQKVLRQMRENKDSILELIEKYLIAVCRLYSEQKAIRIKRTIDRRRISRLQTEPITKPIIFEAKDKKEYDNKNILPTTTTTTTTTTSKIKDLNGDDVASDNRDSTKNAMKRENDMPRNSHHGENDDDDDDHDDEDGNNSLSHEEKMMLQKENDQLFNEMSTMVDEIKQIEGKIVEISRLQEIFSEKVLDQERDIDKLADTVVGASENIKEANEEIREAMKNNAGFRVWVLFFLLVCTFSLLFLDWYNA